MKMFNFLGNNEPKVEGSGLSLYRGGRIKVIIHNKDRSFNEYTCRLKDPYFVEINKKYYMVVERCIQRGKIPTIHFYYNNPAPIEFIHKHTELSAIKLKTQEDLADLRAEEKTILNELTIDADGLRAAMNARILKGIYEGTPIFSLKFIFLAVAVICVIVLIGLQVSGQVDVLGFFGL